MADVNIQQTPSSPSGRGSGAIWAIVVIVLLFLLAWFFFFRGGDAGTGSDVNVDVNPPAQQAPSGGTGGGTTPAPTTP